MFINCVGYVVLNCRMTVSDEWERIWKKVVMACFKVLSNICLEGLKKTVGNLSPDGQHPDWDLKPEPPEYGGGGVLIQYKEDWVNGKY
jgi:hypothetical protein